jgi:hypothetical protein
MERPVPQKKTPTSIRDLYPHLSEEKLKEAEENLDRYLVLSIRIYERIQSDPEAYAQFKALTAKNFKPTIEDDPSNPQQSIHPN